MSRHPSSRAAWAIALLAVACAAGAQASPDGRLLASNCFQCRGTGFERLAGKPAQEIYEEMKEMQNGGEDKGIMSAHANGYTDAQLRALSRWLSRQQP